MLTARRAMVLGFLGGLGLALANCSPQVIPGPTSLLVRVTRVSGFGPDVYAYVFTGSMDGAEAFGETQRPDPLDPSTPLNGPQSVRITFPDDREGKTVAVDVYALNADLTVVGVGHGDGTLVKKTDTLLDITVQPLTSNKDAGGGFDAGPVKSCPCDGGCCGSDGGCFKPLQIELSPDSGVSVAISLCGQNGFTCGGLCQFPQANVCVNGGCQCGTRSPCGKGEWCVYANGANRCVCSQGSGCDGCCDASGNACLKGTDDAICGRGGNTCGSCQAVGKTCKGQQRVDDQNYGFCGSGTGPTLSGCVATQCLSGNSCVDFAFPLCRNLIASHNTCYACDFWRSDHCAPDKPPTGCACGTEDQCPGDQLCYRAAGVPGRCVSIQSNLP